MQPYHCTEKEGKKLKGLFCSNDRLAGHYPTYYMAIYQKINTLTQNIDLKNYFIDLKMILFLRLKNNCPFDSTAGTAFVAM